ncbi:MAG: biotin--[acetyl-CoA-carboxylase] ligase [Saprospiraceae bacterium]|nr:biotin--[acetyl-CoA-carboxylase] ligase [Saprospiraceae bacterium]
MSTVHNSKIVGKVLFEYDTLPSTNSYAIELLNREKPQEGTVISARYQSAGRGQMGTTWESNPGENLMLSVILRPVFLALSDQFKLNKAVSLAVCKMIGEYFPGKVSIKWPNDIYLDDRKICGILIQNGVQGKKLQWSVVGIGININQEVFGTHLHKVTSFVRESSGKFDLPEIRDRLFTCLDHYYHLLVHNPDPLDKEYINALYRLGIPTAFYNTRGEQFTGTIKKVDIQGRLVVEDDNQQLLHFNLKEIIYS